MGYPRINGPNISLVAACMITILVNNHLYTGSEKFYTGQKVYYILSRESPIEINILPLIWYKSVQIFSIRSLLRCFTLIIEN